MATKVHQNVDWHNLPNTDTPINEDNLNKMDKSIDAIDDRVVELMGYEERVAEATGQNEEYALQSKSYAVGATGVRENEDKDNSKYYSQQSKSYAQNASSAMESAQHWAEVAQEIPQTLIDAVESNTTEIGEIQAEIEEIQTDQESQNVHLSTLQYGENYGGENIWDEKWEVGGIVRPDGSLYSNANCIRSVNFNPCTPNDEIYIFCGSATAQSFLAIIYYDADFKYVRGEWKANMKSTVPSNAKYFKLTTQESEGYTYGGTYKNDIAIYEYEEGKTYTYKPYIKSAKMLTSAVDIIGTTTNMLKITLPNTVLEGVTFTVNSEDGTITVNGTAQNATQAEIGSITDDMMGKWLCGCPKGGEYGKYMLYAGNSYDFGEGTKIKSTNVKLYLYIGKGQTLNNTVFKPMITTNLQATYNDFVPFTGTTGRLNADVAEMNRVINGIALIQKVDSGTDANLLTNFGAFYFEGLSSNYTNLPTNEHNFIMLNLYRQSNRKAQIGVSVNTGNWWRRASDASGNYGSWTKF